MANYTKRDKRRQAAIEAMEQPRGPDQELPLVIAVHRRNMRLTADQA